MKELIQIQHELKAPKGQFNNFGKYKYRNCEDILEAVKPLLYANECALTLCDEIKTVAGIGVTYVEATATITNKEGQTIVVKAQAGIDLQKKGMDTAQCFGSSSSYARKYALNGLFCIDDTKDSDASNEHPKKVITKASLSLESTAYSKLKERYVGADEKGQKDLDVNILKTYNNGKEVIQSLKTA